MTVPMRPKEYYSNLWRNRPDSVQQLEKYMDDITINRFYYGYALLPRAQAEELARKNDWTIQPDTSAWRNGWQKGFNARMDE